MRRRWLLVATLALWLVSCSQLPELPPQLRPPPKGEILTVGMLGPIQTVLSTVGQTPEEREVSANLDRPLWDYDETWQLYPVLADDLPKSSLEPQARLLATRLRGTYLWSDGTPVQGSDFDTALHLAQLPTNGRLPVPWVRSVETLNMSQGVLTVRLQGFWPAGGLALVPFPTQASAQLESDPLGGYGHRPICSGPYVVTDWVGEGRMVTLTRNKNFPWVPAARAIPTFRYRFYDRTDRMVRGIRSGDVQLVPRVPPEVLKKVDPNPFMETRWVATDRLEALVLRLDSPVLSEAEVRRALFAALRRSQWIHGLYPGAQVDPARSWMPERVWYFLNVLDRVEEELSDPGFLLDRAGWKGQPVRTKGKLKLELELVYDKNNPVAEKVADQVALYWRRIGVGVNPVGVENLAERLPKRDFAQVALAELPLEPWMSPDQVMGKAGLPTESHPGGLNYSGWLDDQHEAICQAISQARDEMELKPLLARQQQLFAQEMPLLPLFFVPEPHLVSPRLQGYTPRGFGAASYNSEQWTYVPAPSPAPSASPQASPSPSPSP